jgi:hypothetical protein
VLWGDDAIGPFAQRWTAVAQGIDLPRAFSSCPQETECEEGLRFMKLCRIHGHQLTDTPKVVGEVSPHMPFSGHALLTRRQWIFIHMAKPKKKKTILPR